MSGRTAMALLLALGFAGRASAQDSATKARATTSYTFAQVDEPVKYLKGPEVVFPADLKAVGISGSVKLRYIVGTDGLVEGKSVQVLSSTNKEFEKPAIDAIKGSTFKPAVIRLQAVRQIVEQAVKFGP